MSLLGVVDNRRGRRRVRRCKRVVRKIRDVIVWFFVLLFFFQIDHSVAITIDCTLGTTYSAIIDRHAT